MRLSDPALRDALIQRLRAMTAEALRREPSQIRVDWVNPDPGQLWSLLQPFIMRELGFPLHAYDRPHCGSINALAEHLVGELRPPPAPALPMGDLYEHGEWKREPVEHRADPPLERPAVFLLSAPRSGSTMLCAMLARHPKLFAASELSLLPFGSMGARGRLFDSVGHQWMRNGLLVAIQNLTGETRERAEQDYLVLEERDVPVSAVYARMQELAQDRLLVDKSPVYALNPDWLACAERLFRAPRYIHLTRHPGAVVESFVRRRFHRLMGPGLVWDDNPWIFAEKIWTSTNLHIERFLRNVDARRQLRVSYEMLVADPAAAVGRICAFLEIPFDARALDPYGGLSNTTRLEPLGLGDPGFFEHSGIEARLASDWRATGPPQKFGAITRDVARAIDYAIP